MPRHRKSAQRENWPEVLKRFEIIYAALTDNSGVEQTLFVDHALAQRVREYLRERCEEKREPKELPKEHNLLFEFLYSHNQCVGWFWTDDAPAMIRQIAEGTSSQSKLELRVVTR
jgi:hypothetical protein